MAFVGRKSMDVAIRCSGSFRDEPDETVIARSVVTKAGARIMDQTAAKDTRRFYLRLFACICG
jgi:hypothetical protein